MSSKDGTYSGGVDGCEEVSCRLRLPHLTIEMWGTQYRGGTLRCGLPAVDALVHEMKIIMHGGHIGDRDALDCFEVEHVSSK